MDIGTIASKVSEKLVSTDTLTTQLINASKTYIADMQSASEMMYLPAITVNTTSDFRPGEQANEVPPPIQSAQPSGPALPPLPPDMVLHDYVVADPLLLSTSFPDIATPSADNPKISTGEDGSVSESIANQFIAAVISEIQRSNFDDGYVQQVRDGISDRSSLAQEIAARVDNRLSLMGLPPPSQDMLVLAEYQTLDDTRAVSIKQREARVDNNRGMVETAIRLAEILYQHADAVYQRALEVAKTLIEVGNSIYQLQIGIERSVVGVSKTAMETDIEVINAKESVNKLNYRARTENVRIFYEVADLAIRSLENINNQYELAVSRFGVGADKARALSEFDMSKGTLSLQALDERVNAAVQNAANALTSFITVAGSKRYATDEGERVFSEAINGAFSARNTLIQIGKKDTTTS